MTSEENPAEAIRATGRLACIRAVPDPDCLCKGCVASLALDALEEELIDLRGALWLIGGRPARLDTEKVFTSGLTLPLGCTIFVDETPSGCIGTFHPDPLTLSSHSFSLNRDEYSILRRAR